MKQFVLGCTLALFTCGALFCTAQESKKPSSAKPTATENKPDEKKADGQKKAVSNRLPPYFGKLGLSESQRDKIYALQTSYSEQVDSIEAQLEALKQKREQEIDGVLTADQRKALKELTVAAKESKSKPKKAEAEKQTEAGKTEASSDSKEGKK